MKPARGILLFSMLYYSPREDLGGSRPVVVVGRRVSPGVTQPLCPLLCPLLLPPALTPVRKKNENGAAVIHY